MEKIIVAFEGERNALHIKDMIEGAGVAAVQLCRSGMEVRRLLGQETVNTVVCGYKLPDGSAEALFEDLPPGCSMLMVAPQTQLDLCGEKDIFKLPAPVHRGDLIATVSMLLKMGSRLERYLTPQRSREDRGIIEQAKKLLMYRHGMTEEEAHQLLQRRSMGSGAKLVQAARLVLGEG